MALINCPECSKEISSDSKKCIHCGCNVKKRLAQQKKEYERTHEVCHKCKKDKPKTDKFCPHCGAKRKRSAFEKFVIISAVIFVCSIINSVIDSGSTQKSNSATPSQSKQVANVSDSYVCRAAIATAMMKDIRIVKLDGKTSNYYNLSYIRAADGSKWGFRCYLKGSKIIWSTDGRNNTTSRWRTSPNDEKLSFRASGNKLIITSSMMGQKSFKIPSK